ncbi:MAG: DNA-binding domain-containing protein [Deltaproteobacteria bacterium]|nr:DNA-binding domain-containing protein [Deltaproteobacteria bacterium]
MRLAQTERLMTRYILSRGQTRLPPVKNSGALSAKNRLDIYANMYFLRLHDVLKENFPSVFKKFGKKKFQSLVIRYLKKYPSRYYSITDVGRNLPLFLKGREGASFDWAVLQASIASDALVLTREALAKIPSDKWATTRLKTVPSLHIIKQGKGKVAVWRKPDFKVYHRKLSGEEALLLQEMGKPIRFGRLCSFLARTHSPEKASRQMAVYLGQWLQAGLLAV